jgi:hypothetical protein
MMPHAFAALHETEVPYQAVTPATHSGYPTILEHRMSMHCAAIPSILDRFESMTSHEEQNKIMKDVIGGERRCGSRVRVRQNPLFLTARYIQRMGE